MKIASYSIIPCLVWNLPFAQAMLIGRPRSSSYTTLPVAFNTRSSLSSATFSHHHKRLHYLSGAYNHPLGVLPSRTDSKNRLRGLPSTSLWAQQPLRGGDAGDGDFDGAVDSMIGNQKGIGENEELDKVSLILFLFLERMLLVVALPSSVYIHILSIHSLIQEAKQLQQNSKYIKGLIENLEGVLDKWIISGSLATVSPLDVWLYDFVASCNSTLNLYVMANYNSSDIPNIC